MTAPPDHPAIPAPRIGVLLINLGTPDAPDAGSVRRYLAQFLSDPRVIEIPRIVWAPILHGISAATGFPLEFEHGVPTARTIGAYGLPILRDSPEVSVELLESEEEPGGVTELAVPTAAPAVANALFSLTGQRLRSLPLTIGSRR